MKQKTKQFWSFFLSFMMVLSLVPMSAFAATGSDWQIERSPAAPDPLYHAWNEGTQQFDPEGGAEPVVTSPDGDVTISKRIKGTETENKFEITLDVQTQRNPNAAVVLILDASGSMESNCAECGNSLRKHTSKRIDVCKGGTPESYTQYVDANRDLKCDACGQVGKDHDSLTIPYACQETKSCWDVTKASAMAFATEFAGNDVNVQRQIAVVAYHGDATISSDWLNIAGGQSLDILKNTINGIQLGNYTNIQAGLRLGYNLLNTIDDEQINPSNQFAVLLTDGQPNRLSDVNDKNWNATAVGTTLPSTGTRDEPAAANATEAVAQAITDDLGAKLYSVGFGDTNRWVWEGKGRSASNDHSDKQIADWLKSFSTHGFTCKNVNQIAGEFANILNEMNASAEALRVTDPMGDFITLNPESIKDDSGAVFANNQLTWTLTEAQALEPGLRGIQTTPLAKYQMTYTITLDTAQKGFEENKYYLTNGRTQLHYVADCGETLLLDFLVPAVEGKIPMIPYSVQYFKLDKMPDDKIENVEAWKSALVEWKKDHKNYDATTTFNGKVPAWTTVSAPDGYQDKYTGDNYQFVKGESERQIIPNPNEETDNVFRLYYDPFTTEVTINRYTKTTTIDKDGNQTVSEYAKPTTSQDGGFVGDKYAIENPDTWNGYALDPSQANTTKIEQLAPESNVLNLYYSKTVDERATASMTVKHIYKTYGWVNTNGQWAIEEIGTQQAIEVDKKTDLKMTQTYSTSLSPMKTMENYACVDVQTNAKDLTKNDGKAEVTLNHEANVMDLFFDNKATLGEPESTEVTVNHHYTWIETVIENGKPKTTTHDAVDTQTFTTYRDGWVTVAEQTTNPQDQLSYTASEANAAKLKFIATAPESNVVDLYYTLTTAPKPTRVTVKHILQEQITIPATETEPERTEVRDVDTLEQHYPDPADGSRLYAGESFTATQYTGTYEGFVCVSEDPEFTIAELEPEINVIELRYLKDNRTEATIQVTHTYNANRTTVDGSTTKVVLDHDGTGDPDNSVAQAGDKFTPTAQTNYQGNTYELTEESKALIKEYTLHAGSNNTIALTYLRSYSDLEDAGQLAVKHHYMSRDMIIQDGKAVYPDDFTEVGLSERFTVNTGKEFPESSYVGQTFTVDALPIYNGVTYELRKTDNQFEVTLTETPLTKDYYYEIQNPLPEVTVQDQTFYQDTVIDEQGISTTTQSQTDVGWTARLLGETIVITPISLGRDLKEISVKNGETILVAGTDYTVDAETNAVTLSAADGIKVDFIFTSLKDNSKKATYTVNHHYRTLDWNSPADTAYTTEEANTGSSFAGLQLIGTPNDKNGIYTLDEAQTSGAFAEGTYTIALAEGANTIDFYYTNKIDTRVEKPVTVEYLYRVYDTYTKTYSVEERSEDAGWTKDDGAYLGNTFTVGTLNGETFTVAKKFDRPERIVGADAQTLTYKFERVDPTTGSILVQEPIAGTPSIPGTEEEPEIPAIPAIENRIVISYLREVSSDPGDSTYTVEHKYFYDGSLNHTLIVPGGTAHIGDTIKASDLTQLLVNQGRSYNYGGASTDAITVQKDSALNVIVLNYNYTPSGGSRPDPRPDPTPDPETEILEPEVPLAELPIEPEINIPEPEVPLGDLPEPTLPEPPTQYPTPTDETIIIDEETPLGNLPQTGSISDRVHRTWMLILAAVVGPFGVAITFSRKRKDD